MNVSKHNSEISEDHSDNNQFIFKQEDNLGYQADIMIHHDQLEKINRKSLSLSKDEIFHDSTWNLTKKILSRKNEVVYCVSTQEMSVDISDASGKVYLPLLTKNEVNKKLSKLKPELRKKITTVHLGAVKILVTAQFQSGIDTPIKMALIDNRIKTRKDCLLGAAKGNLCYGKFMFTVYPKFGVSLSTQRFDQILSFIHEFTRSDLMEKGDKIFSVTYLTAYALTNSIHSIAYKNQSNIEIDELFQELGNVQERPFCDISSQEEQWSINIDHNKTRINQPRQSIRNNTITIGESGNTPDQLLRQMSKNVDSLRTKLEQICGNE
nr:movement protein [Dahlia common mosaic virus]